MLKPMRFACFALVFGCGGTTAGAPVDGGGDVATGDTSTSDARLGDGGCVVTSDAIACIHPVEGAACGCTSDSCPMPGDPCCIGYVWECGETHVWTKLGLGCACTTVDSGAGDGRDASGFACGAKTCSSGSICVGQEPGVPLPDGGTPPTSYSCSDLPSACVATPTCDCVKRNLPTGCTLGSCNADASGHITIDCMGA